MAIMDRYRVGWSGAAVTGGGVSTFYFDSAEPGAITSVWAFIDGIKSLFPSSVSWHFPNVGDQVDSATGDIVGTWNAGTEATLTGGSGSPDYAKGVGARVVWNTTGRRNNRLVRGSTFLLPLAVTSYEGDGTISAASLATLRAKATLYVTNTVGAALIWSKPQGGANGAAHQVVSGTVPDAVTWLRSRRT